MRTPENPGDSQGSAGTSSLLDSVCALIEDGLDAGLSYTEAAMPAADWIKRNGLESEFFAIYGAVALGYLYRQRNTATRNNGLRAAQPPDRMNAKSLRGRLFDSYMHVDGRQVRLGDMTKAQCFSVAKEYERQTAYNDRLAGFWHKVAMEIGAAVTVRDQWREAAFAELLRKAEDGGA